MTPTHTFPTEASRDAAILAIEEAIDNAFDDLHEGGDQVDDIANLIDAYDALGGDESYSLDTREALARFTNS